MRKVICESNDARLAVVVAYLADQLLRKETVHEIVAMATRI